MTVRYAQSRKDANHNLIANLFRSLGWTVHDVHQIPNFADIIISRNRYTALVEIKDGSKPPSERRLTPGEHEFATNWSGDYLVVECEEDVFLVDREQRLSARPESCLYGIETP